MSPVRYLRYHRVSTKVMIKKIFNGIGQGFLKEIIVVAMIFSALILIFTPAAKTLALDSDEYWGGTVQRNYVNTNSGLANGGRTRDPREVAVDIIRLALGFLGIIAVIIILYAGFKWMMSGGNEESISAAKKTLIAAVIGLVIILVWKKSKLIC